MPIGAVEHYVLVAGAPGERDDRGWKSRDYRTIASLEEYVLVSQEMRRVEVFRRSTNWGCEAFTSGDTLDLRGARLSVDALYDE